MKDGVSRLNGFIEADELPPPYSSPSNRSMASTHSSSKYSSLLQYLESEIGDDGDNPVESMKLTRGEIAFDDDLSSMSLSPGRRSDGTMKNKSLAIGNGAQTFLASVRATGAQSSPSKSSRTQGGRSYVWDEWGNDEKLGRNSVSPLTGDDEGTAGDNATYFSLKVGDSHVAPLENMARSGIESTGSGLSKSDINGGASRSLQRVVGDLKVKIDALKGQLLEKTSHIRDLQSELARLSTAKARRVQKFRSTGEAQLAAQREELGAALKKNNDFVDKLGSDIKQLTVKRDGLKDKQGRFSSQRDAGLQLLRDEIMRKMQRTRRQWEAEERAVFDKVLKSKEELLKKAAAESFGPALDKMVIEGKEAVRERQDEVNKRLERVKRELNTELADKLNEARDVLRVQIKDDDERTRRAGERQLQDVLRRHSEEIEAIKLKIAREKRLAEETAERTRRIDAETSLEGMREIRRSEAQQAMELMSALQRELAQLVASHSEAVKALKDSFVAEEVALAERLRKDIQASSSHQREEAKSRFLSKLNTETEKVIAKLREDSAVERKQIRDGIESEMDDLRMSAQRRLDAMQIAETRYVCAPLLHHKHF